MAVTMRLASPNERRLICREDLGVYNALVVGAIYEFEHGRLDIRSSISFIGPLQHCIDKHPMLGVAMRDRNTDRPVFEQVSAVNIEDHISIHSSHEPALDDAASIERLLPSLLDHPWPPSIPEWKVVILPLHSSQPADLTRCFIAFSYSHALGDGLSGPLFHLTFLDALQHSRNQRDPSQVATPLAGVPAPFDTKDRLPISWGFLLAPLIALFLPKFLTELFGLRVVPNSADTGTWIGPAIFEPKAFRTKLKLLEVQASEVSKALKASAKNDTKLTATLHQLITRALSTAIADRSITNFVSQTAISMRHSIDVSNNDIGNCVSGYYGKHPRVDASQPISIESWKDASLMTKKMAECAVTLQDQPIGLLRYVPDIRQWMIGKVGQKRDSSYEVSNLGAIVTTGGNVWITKMVFAQPANISVLLAFNIVSVKEGSLMCTITWQPGTLDVPEESEEEFIKGICTSLQADLSRLA